MNTVDENRVAKKKQSGKIRKKGQIDWMITLLPLGLIAALSILFFLLPEQSNTVLAKVRFFLGDTFGVYYLAIGLGVFLLSLYLAFSKYGDIVLGEQDEKPKYSFFAWGSMMFTCGLAADILFYSFAEWVMYAADPQIEKMGGIHYDRNKKIDCEVVFMLQNKIAVVTGGTRGIGYAIVQKFLQNGAKVVLFGSREETVVKAVASLKEENPDWDVSGAWPKLTDAAAMADEIAKIKEKYGRIDILVNNAGVSDSTPLDKYTAEHFANVMDLNVNAMMNGILPAAAIMKEQGGGCILNTSSMVSICGQPGGVAYPSSKYAVNGLTWSLARELGPFHIRVNAVAPGITRTDMVAALPKEMIDPLISHIPLRRIGEAEDIANAFLFLASDMASYITGEILSVDGAMRT